MIYCHIMTPWELHIIIFVCTLSECLPLFDYNYSCCMLIIAFHETRIQHPDEIPTPIMDTRITITTENILTKDLSTFITNQRRVHLYV